jgi:hypothetical protein
MYTAIYFIIGAIIGLASCLKRWESYSNLPEIQKILVSQRGEMHWMHFVVIFISRLLLWPVYIVANFIS